jgi:hypothetical protein
MVDPEVERKKSPNSKERFCIMPTGPELYHHFLNFSNGQRREIGLFRALIDSFSAFNENALAREYHGAKYQVIFQENRGAGRSHPRCELCDFLLIYYPFGNPAAARLTWNQAKVTNKSFCRGTTRTRMAPRGFFPVCHFQSNSSLSFKANLEQWDLLSNRPLIRGATANFNPPSNLLEAAVLPSAGSFGVFYPVNGHFDLFFFVAETLVPLNNNPGRSGTIHPSVPIHLIREIQNYDEITSTCCLKLFGEALDRNLIGTPLSELLVQQADREEIRNWLSNILITLRGEYPDSELPNELLRAFDLPLDTDFDSSASTSPARATVLFRTQINAQRF